MSEPSQTNDFKVQAQELLCLRCKRGDRRAWEELVAQWERPLFYYVRRMAGSHDEALLVLQDVWLQVFSSLPSLRDPRRLGAWLYTITRRVFIRHIGRPAEEGGQQELSSIPEDEPREGGMREDDSEWVHWGLGKLAAAQREVLVLFFLEDLSLKEIGDLLGIPVGTVKSRLSKARGLLREVLNQGEYQ